MLISGTFFCRVFRPPPAPPTQEGRGMSLTLYMSRSWLLAFCYNNFLVYTTISVVKSMPSNKSRPCNPSSVISMMKFM